jgi:hypothetical protein
MPDELPGELVGAYRINGALTENSCGSAALPAADPLSFSVEIRKQGQSGLWLAAAPPAHPGSLSDDGAFSFQRQSTYDVGGRARQPVELLTEMDIDRLADPEAAQQLGENATAPCRLTITERIDGTVLRESQGRADAGDRAHDTSASAGREEPRDSEVDLVADNEIGVVVVAGSDCRASLKANGGPFEQLPCAVRYELEGELIER